jgi:trehalose 6-phosphate phosphatase
MKGWRKSDRSPLDRSWAGRPLLVGLDFDGTLSPLVHRPAQARLPGATRRLLARLQRIKGVRVAIISGRELSDIMQRVALPNIYYSGNHGLTIRGPGIDWCHPKAHAASEEIQRLAGVLAGALDGFPRTRLENKELTLTIHYRGAKREHALKLGRFLKRLIRNHRERLLLSSGKKIWEIRPHLSWSKGHALIKIAKSAAPGARLIFIGDDRTDEDGFRALGSRPVTIRVGPARESVAKLYLAHQKQVAPLLKTLYKALTDRPRRP